MNMESLLHGEVMRMHAASYHLSTEQDASQF